jgi:hypothetical protein
MADPARFLPHHQEFIPQTLVCHSPPTRLGIVENREGWVFLRMAERVTGWQPDPSGVHEFRFFSFDGRPTRLVSDGGRRTNDPPRAVDGDSPSTVGRQRPPERLPAPLPPSTSSPSFSSPSLPDIPLTGFSESGDSRLPWLRGGSNDTGRLWRVVVARLSGLSRVLPQQRGRRALVALGLCAVVALGVYGGEIATASQSNTTPPTPSNLREGVYVGPADPSGVVSFANTTKTQPSIASDYLPSNAGWNGMDGADGSLSWMFANGWQGSSYTLSLGVPIIPTDSSGDSVGTLAIGATGAYNSYFVTLAQTLVAAGESNAYLRLGWEFDGGWYAWSATTPAEDPRPLATTTTTPGDRLGQRRSRASPRKMPRPAWARPPSSIGHGPRRRVRYGLAEHEPVVTDLVRQCRAAERHHHVGLQRGGRRQRPRVDRRRQRHRRHRQLEPR